MTDGQSYFCDINNDYRSYLPFGLEGEKRRLELEESEKDRRSIIDEIREEKRHMAQQVLVPRLEAQGADLNKIRILDGFTKKVDGKEVGEMELTLQAVDQIRDAIRLTEQETGEPVRLIVVDPISNYWGGIKENDNTQVRQVLKPIQRLAEETGAAFLLITHFGKGIKEESADKVIGSIAITAVARTVWYLYRDKDDKDCRYFVPSKDNILIDPTGGKSRRSKPRLRLLRSLPSGDFFTHHRRGFKENQHRQTEGVGGLLLVAS